MRSRLPLEPAGWVVLTVGVIAIIGSWLVGWRELLILGVGSVLALLCAIPFVIGGSKLRLERELTPDRVTVGEPAFAELTATNAGAAPMPSIVVHDFVDGKAEPITIPALGSKESSTQTFALPTARRGVRRVGPARLTKSDPFRLMLREAGQTDTDTLWVRPRVLPLGAFAYGLNKDIDGPTFDTSPAGDVAFHSVRPYQMGDDARHVHWMATAKTGEMMVRHYVDNRQPYLSVVVDNAESSYGSVVDFDVAIEVAASLGVSSLVASRPFSVHIGDRGLVGRSHPTSREQLLDDLTEARLVDEFDITADAPRLISAERETTVTLLVTGGRPASDFLQSITQLRQTGAVIVVRCVADGSGEDRLMGLGGASVLTVESLDEFAMLLGSRALV